MGRVVHLALVTVALAGCARSDFIDLGPVLPPDGGGDATGGDGDSCVPRTCAELGATCGDWTDGCGNPLGCGSCSDPQICGGGARNNVCGVTYYVAATGGADAGSGRSVSDPWASFARAWAELAAGDALILMDGTYTEVLAPTISGTADAPIAIRSQSDGGAIVDGEHLRIPCSIRGVVGAELGYLEIEGIRCMRGTTMVLSVRDAHHVTLRRVTAHDGDVAESLLSIYEFLRTPDILVVDSAGWGAADVVFEVRSSERASLRRCYARSLDRAGSGEIGIIVRADSVATLIENCVVAFGGFMVRDASHTRSYGNVVYDARDWSYRDSGENGPNREQRLRQQCGHQWPFRFLSTR